MDLGLKNKRALVLCSTRGIGFGIAQALAAEQASVAIMGRSIDKVQHAVSELRKRYDTKIVPITVDLTASDCVEQINKNIIKKFGGIDILVNNTFGPPVMNVLEVTFEQWQMYFNQMVLTLITLTNSLIPYMQEKRWGRILTVVSSGVIQPINMLSISNILRASLVGWSKNLANIIAKDGITVNTIIPGRINTERLQEIDQAVSHRSQQSIEDVKNKSLMTIPIGRYGTVEEFAAMAAFLVSEKASYITGSLIRVDGGLISSI